MTKIINFITLSYISSTFIYSLYSLYKYYKNKNKDLYLIKYNNIVKFHHQVLQNLMEHFVGNVMEQENSIYN